MRDFERNAGLIKKEKEAEKAEKARKEKAKTDTQSGKKNVKGKKRPGGDWAAWGPAQRAKQAAAKGEAMTDSPEKNRRRNRIISNNSRRAQLLIPL